MQITTKFFLFSILTALFFIAPVETSQAQEKWIAHNENKIIYEVRIPEDHNVHSAKMNIGSKGVAFGEKIQAIIPGSGGDPVDRLYSLQVSQTLGRPIDPSYVKAELEERIKSYLNKFIPYNGVLLQRENFSDSHGMHATDLHLTYDDPKIGTTHLRTKIYLTGVTRALQSVVGSEAAMYSYRTRDFFDSMTMYDGYILAKKPLKEMWKPYVSPLNIFTAYFPEQDRIFSFMDPIIHNSEKNEVMLYKIFDPYYEKAMIYNIYGYRFGASLNQDLAISVVLKRHLAKQSISVSNDAFRKPKEGAIEIVYSVRPHKTNGYSNFGKIYAEYNANYMIVHEMWGPENLIESSFTDSIIDATEFHPQKAWKKLQEEGDTDIKSEPAIDNEDQRLFRETMQETVMNARKKERAEKAGDASDTDSEAEIEAE